MAAGSEVPPRLYHIKRSQHLGYGFIAGYDHPTMVKHVEPDGPSFGRLKRGDVIMSVNGIDVESAPCEQIIKMIQLCDQEIEIIVRNPSYEEMIRAKNLADPKFYTFNNPREFQHGPVTGFNRPAAQQMTISPLISNQWRLDRLVTSISQQKNSPTSTSPNEEQQVQINHDPMLILKQRVDDNGASLVDNNNNNNQTSTLGRGGHSRFGRFSPLPQRCKTSIDGTKTLKPTSKKSGEDHNDQRPLKRSNTMRPIRPPAKVMEIFEVVIRIFFEDGHTRVLNYNQDTTVSAILETLNSRLVGSSTHSDEIKRYFGLVLTVHSEGTMKERKVLHSLHDNDSIMKIRQLPYAPKLRLLYRMIHPPPDVNKLYTQERVAFEYLYKQACNDLRADRFSPPLEVDTAIKLGTLHLVEYVYSNHPKAHGNSKDPKLFMRLIKKTPGINHFLPGSLIDTTLDKKGKRIIGQYKKLKLRLAEQLKKNFNDFDFEPPKVRSTTNLNRYTSTSFHELSLPEYRSSPSDYVKLMFLNYLSQLSCYTNTEKQIRPSASPIDRNSVGDCSNSLESVPRTSDSSPLIKQERNYQLSQYSNGHVDQQSANNISRLAQMNSMRSVSSLQPPAHLPSQHLDQTDNIAQTPSSSRSSITFNMESSPSPQQAPSSNILSPQSSEVFTHTETQRATKLPEPSPIPRQQVSSHSRHQDYNSVDRLYDQRFPINKRPWDEFLQSAVILPPPPMLATYLNATTPVNNNLEFSKHKFLPMKQSNYVTPIITDFELERLRVPRPPRLTNQNKLSS